MVHVVLDLEMNPVDRKEKLIRKSLTDEVIEIGAVKLNEKYEQIGTFQKYIKPEYGPITKKITQLTGITNEQVANEGNFEQIFLEFMSWTGKEVTLYSWSNSDIYQLKCECAYKLKAFEVKWLETHWIDLQKEFDERIGLSSSTLALKHAVGAMNRNFKGTAHTALADAENTAAILSLMQDDEAFKKTMQPVIDLLKPQTGLSTTIGDLFPELLKLKL